MRPAGEDSWVRGWGALKRLRRYRCLLLLLFAVSPLVACSSQTLAPSASVSSPSLAKVAVEHDGIYMVSHADLVAAGLNVSGIDVGKIGLSSQGADVPILVRGEGTELTIVFYGIANAGPYSRTNVYWLDLEAAGPARMKERVASSGPCGAPAASYTATVRAEEDLFYAAAVAPGEDQWYWQKLLAPQTAVFAVSLPDVTPGDAHLRLALLGYTADPVEPDHHVEIALNECSLGNAMWDGQRPFTLEAAVPHSCLNEGDNLVEVQAIADTGARADIVLVDRVELEYQRRFVARDDTLDFEGASGSNVVSGFSSDQVWLFDVGNPADVIRITGGAVGQDGAGYSLSFCGAGAAGRRYLAVSEAGLFRPTSIDAVTQSSDLRSVDNQADYLVITHEGFEAALEPLVEWRRGQGLSVQVLGINQVYDQFSYGLADPQAIRELLIYARASWTRPAPLYVLLVGKASYDYLDHLQGPNKSLVPTYLVDTAFSGQTLSDNWFVCLDGEDVLPDMAIGRLPVSTADEARAVVEKILAYEENAPPGDWRQRILLVADGAQASFAADSDRLAAESVPSGYEVSRVYAGSLEDPPSALVQELTAGSLIVNYLGHGSIDTWSEEGLFASEQIALLDNDGRQPLVILMSCLLGFFGHPERDSMAEELLLAEGGGAVAVFAPSSLTLSSDQGPLNRALLGVLLRGGASTVGQALLEAKRSLPVETQGQRDVIETFALLGDPALRLAGAE